jgi:hypothetical protein
MSFGVLVAAQRKRNGSSICPTFNLPKNTPLLVLGFAALWSSPWVGMAMADDHAPRTIPQGTCLDVVLQDQPILRWCETPTHYTYEILTWGEQTRFEKKSLDGAIETATRGFLERECLNENLSSIESARVSLWLSVPDSAMELAAPRIGVQLSQTGREQLNLIFSQSWKGDWTASYENMHILGKSRYDETSGQSISGRAPQQVMFRALRLFGAALDQSTVDFLQSKGLSPGPRLSPTVPRFLGYTATYREDQVLEALRNDPQANEHLVWIEPNHRIESIGERVPLFERPLPLGLGGQEDPCASSSVSNALD